MMRVAIGGLAMLLMGAQNAPAIEEPMAPSGKWIVQFADSSCTLSRNYGTDPDGFQIGFIPTPGADSMEMTLIHPSKKIVGDVGEAKVQLLPGGKEVPVDFTDYSVTGARLVRMRVMRSQLGDLAAAKSIRIDWPGKRKTTHLQLSSIASAHRTLDSCVADLLQQWGFTPEMMARIATRPEPTNNPARWITHEDYPEKLVRKGVSGTVRVRFIVDVAGRVTDCRVIASSGSTELDTHTCALVTKRARYKAAKAADGTAVPSIVVEGFVWWTSNSPG